MFQDENNIYEIAYMMCNESIKKNDWRRFECCY